MDKNTADYMGQRVDKFRELHNELKRVERAISEEAGVAGVYFRTRNSNSVDYMGVVNNHPATAAKFRAVLMEVLVERRDELQAELDAI